MKKLLTLALLFTSIMTTIAQEQVWETDVRKAVDQSIKTNKPMLFFFTGSDWCGWCIRLQREVFKTPEFTEWASKNVILVELDYPRGKAQSPEIQKQNGEMRQVFPVQGFPTIWFAGAEKKDAQINFIQLGSTGYVEGGPTSWLAVANQYIAKYEKPKTAPAATPAKKKPTTAPTKKKNPATKGSASK
jgi:thioredoxin-related protein